MTSIGASFDNVMKRVENQEAVAEQAIAEARKAAGEAKVRLNRVRRDGQTLQRRLGELEHAESLWTERAKATASTDRQRAQECVRRLKQVKGDLLQTRAEIARHVEFEKQLSHDIRAIDDKITELKRRKNTLAAREQRAKAAQASQVFCPEDPCIDAVFERWEDKLIASEVLAVEETDDFADSFADDELRAELDVELEALLNEVTSTDNQSPKSDSLCS